jgi:hypothetical protein
MCNDSLCLLNLKMIGYENLNISSPYIWTCMTGALSLSILMLTTSGRAILKQNDSLIRRSNMTNGNSGVGVNYV